MDTFLKTLGILVLLNLATASLAADQIVLVEDGQAKAVIVYRGGAASAATALRLGIEKMTGVSLELISEANFTNQGTAIIVGQTELARQAGIDIQQYYWAGDHYVIRTENTSFAQHVYLVGNDDYQLTGTTYAAYDLLQRLGCGWYGPDQKPLWEVIPQRSTLALGPLNVDERPAFLMRRIWGAWSGKLGYAWRLGGIEIPSGHSLEYLVPSNQYPQYYDGHGQPCLACPEVVDIILKQFRDTLDTSQGRVVPFSLSANDNPDFHNCPQCLAIGNESAQIIYFANSIARELSKTHPNRFILSFLAYWPTHDVPNPIIRTEPPVYVTMVGEGNHMQPLDNMPEPPQIAALPFNNTREVTDFTGWRQTGGLVGIYEWWVPGIPCGWVPSITNATYWKQMPWYSGETALRNLRYWHKGGVRYVIYEAWANDGDAHPERWPLFYVGARGLWDPKVTSDQVMAEACQKLYGPASTHMLKFYQVIEQAAWYAGTQPHLSGQAWVLPSPELIYTPQVVAQATEHLQAAAALAGSLADQNISQRIAEEQQMWQTASGLLDGLR